MTDPHAEDAISDETLVAYWDDELGAAERERVERRLHEDEALAARLRHLSCGGTDFAAAFAPLLAAAPRDRLERMLDAAAGRPAASPARRSGGSRPGWRARPETARFSPGRRKLLALAAACVLLGVAVDRGTLALLGQPAPAGDDWRDAAADYLALYTRQTLEEPPGRAVLQRQLDAAGAALDLALTADRVTVPGLDLRLVQTLSYDGRPMAQIAYLDAAGTPVALCIIARPGDAIGLRQERRQALAIVDWSTTTHGFMLAGRASSESTLALADQLRRALAA